MVRLLSVLVLCLLGAQALAQDVSSKAPPLSPLDSIKTMEIQPGYRLIPVLTEPHIHEPAGIAWDGNGRMYVLEMRTYMQDIDGKNQHAPTSRVSRHEDTDGDGVYDKHTVFADNLTLPRMVLPLLDRVLIRETNTLDLKSYQDTDNDGVADKIDMFHEGGNRGGNLEHQPSGLIWNIDNWCYTTYSRHRYRFTGGKVVRQNLPHGSGQWGLTHDDVGRVFYSTAGGENPAMDFQRPIIYGQISLPGEQAPGFREVFPIDTVPDVQGGRGRVRSDNSLNHFTGCCGQSIYRGTGLPSDFYGDLIIPEPVGRLIRRAKVTNDQGRIVVANAYDKSEFIRASDPNFRPVNSATGPDGCLYIVDMYRGIIQEGNWVREGSYLREVVKDYELQKNIGRGRIYRVEHETTKRGPQPRMLDETPAQLVRHLAHANGWWRSTAQKLIVLHGDQSVTPALVKMLSESDQPLARLHALWTLEGLDAITPELLKTGFKDSDGRVRSAAMRISEMTIAVDRTLDGEIEQLAQDTDPDVAIQVMLSLGKGGHPEAGNLVERIIANHPDNAAIRGIARQQQARREAMEAERRKLAELRRRNKLLAESVVRGKAIYTTLCSTCHGLDGRGQASPDQAKQLLAPPLSGSPRVRGHKARLTRILLNGMVGPVDGKTYGIMLPMGANTDQWIADVGTYIRNSWDNKAPLIEPADVQVVRKESASRLGPWTLKELKFYDPPAFENRSLWKLSASHGNDKTRNAIDGEHGSRWDTGTVQRPGMWFMVELPEATRVTSMTLDTRGSRFDYPRDYTVVVSNDGKNWSDVVARGSDRDPITRIEMNLPEPVRFIRIEQNGASPNKYWSIHELSIKGLPADAKPPVSLAKLLADADWRQLAAEARRKGDARRGVKHFFNAALSCSKCHDADSKDKLGPDLASKRDGVTDLYLVESVLNPAAKIRDGFKMFTVITDRGLAITGFKVQEDGKTVILREPAGAKEIKLAKEDIDEVFESPNSAMPHGLVNQLQDRSQFLDLIRFLMDVNEGGPERMAALKSSFAE